MYKSGLAKSAAQACRPQSASVCFCISTFCSLPTRFQRSLCPSAAVLQVLKIVSRKQANRLRIGEHGIYAVLKHLRRPGEPRIAAEGANVILNICYEKSNVDLVLRCNGVQPLIKFLSHGDADVVANAAGAIQSICFQVRCARCRQVQPHIHVDATQPASPVAVSALDASGDSAAASTAHGCTHIPAWQHVSTRCEPDGRKRGARRCETRMLCQR